MRFVLAALLIVGSAAQALALDVVRFGTNWLAQGEHGGFYQAVADGTYERLGLKVEIVQGGPQAQNRNLMLAGKLDFYMAGNMIQPLAAIQNDVPIVEVAAIFQKDPSAILVHPESRIDRFADLAKLPVLYLSKDTVATSWRWMKASYFGFRDEQVKPYAFSPAPFLANKDSAQQGYVTSEPFAIRSQGGFEPKVFLLADAGFASYSTLIETTRQTVETKPDLVQRFVDGSIIGWRTYLNGDNTAGNAAIKAQNPEMTDAQLAASLEAMKRYGIVQSGDALTGGIGCMTAARQKAFYDELVKVGIVPAGLEIGYAYTTRFVCRKVGLD